MRRRRPRSAHRARARRRSRGGPRVSRPRPPRLPRLADVRRRRHADARQLPRGVLGVRARRDGVELALFTLGSTPCSPSASERRSLSRRADRRAPAAASSRRSVVRRCDPGRPLHDRVDLPREPAHRRAEPRSSRWRARCDRRLQPRRDGSSSRAFISCRSCSCSWWPRSRRSTRRSRSRRSRAARAPSVVPARDPAARPPRAVRVRAHRRRAGARGVRGAGAARDPGRRLGVHVADLARAGQYPAHLGQAGAYALPLLALTALGVFLLSRLSRARRRVRDGHGAAASARVAPTSARWRWPALAARVRYLAVAVVLPLLVLVYASTQPYYSAPDSPRQPRTMTLSNYRDGASSTTSCSRVLNSVVLGVGTARRSCSSWRRRGVARACARGCRGRWLIDGLAFLPIADSGARARRRAARSSTSACRSTIYGTLWILLIAYFTRTWRSGCATRPCR